MYNHRSHVPVIVALDYDNEVDALKLAVHLPSGSMVKVGNVLHTAAPGVVKVLTDACQLSVFLDLKFHDIPKTVAEACRVGAKQGVSIISIHASGGGRMMAAAVEALADMDPRPLLVAVTVLTGMGQGDLREVGVSGDVSTQVLALSRLARTCGVDGVVCSPAEVALLREHLGWDIVLVTPGVRPFGAEHHDQRRIATPRAAIMAGADYLVVGRPIIAAHHPLRAFRSITREAHEALCEREMRSLAQ